MKDWEGISLFGWLRKSFGNNRHNQTRQPNPARCDEQPKWIWCLVANVRTRETMPYRSKGGTKHFAPGAKVYLCQPSWSWDGSWPVLGKKKGTQQLIRKVMAEHELENFRLKRVYSPTVISWMAGDKSRTAVNHGDASEYGNLFHGWGNTPEDRREIAECVCWLNQHTREIDEERGATAERKAAPRAADRTGRRNLNAEANL